MKERHRWYSRSMRRACVEIRAMTGVNVRSSSSVNEEWSSVVVLAVSKCFSVGREPRGELRVVDELAVPGMDEELGASRTLCLIPKTCQLS